jgi:molybdopterin-synthase adenylyltransferase
MKLRAIRRSTEPFARQRLIPGWDQERVERARVLIAGIGALGNACAADLVLTGVRHFALVDNDTVETSNLSRTILFRQGDQGRRKVDAAQQRLAAMAPARDAQIVAIPADVVWGLGWGVFRRMDLVLACLDSTEARAAVGAAAWTHGVPTVVGGIFGFDGGVIVQGAGEGPCVACTFGSKDWSERGVRYSCDEVARLVVPHALIPTTQVIASLTSALMVSEALQVLHGDVSHQGVRLHFTGRRPDLCRVLLRRRLRCPYHLTMEYVHEDARLSITMTARALVEHFAASYGADVTIHLGRDFLLTAACKGCGSHLPLWRPRYATNERDLVCDTCWAAGRETVGNPMLETTSAISLKSPSGVLDLSLEALGIPPLHILAVTSNEATGWIELTGDADRVLPGWPAREPSPGGQSCD